MALQYLIHWAETSKFKPALVQIQSSNQNNFPFKEAAVSILHGWLDLKCI